MEARLAVLTLGLFLVTHLFGCAGGAADINVRVAEADRPDIDGTIVAMGRRAIPKDHAFNIVKFASGQDGRASQGISKSVEGNGGLCEAKVEGEGTAWGEFQLGYTFDNTSGQIVHAAIRLNITVDGRLAHESNTPNSKSIPSGTASLTFVVKDTLGVAIRQETLYTAEIGTGAKEENRKHDVVFEALLEPNRGYYVVIAGRVDAAALGPDQKCSVAIEASDISIEIDWKLAAPTTQASGG